MRAACGTGRYVRHLYYLGRIQCVQLEYTESYSNLNQAYRKAPQNTAVGFRTAVTKLSIIVQLLMGDIPERSLFSEPTTAQAVAPYLELTQVCSSVPSSMVHDAATILSQSSVLNQPNNQQSASRASERVTNEHVFVQRHAFLCVCVGVYLTGWILTDVHHPRRQTGRPFWPS